MLPLGHSTHSWLKFPSDVEGGTSVCMVRVHSVHPSEFSGLMLCCGQLWHLECSVDQNVPVQTHAHCRPWYVHPMFKQWYVQTAVCSYSGMFIQWYVHTVVCSNSGMFKQWYAQTVVCSHSGMFKQRYVQTVVCSNSGMFVQWYIQTGYLNKVVCYSYVQKVRERDE